MRKKDSEVVRMVIELSVEGRSKKNKVEYK